MHPAIQPGEDEAAIVALAVLLAFSEDTKHMSNAMRADVAQRLLVKFEEIRDEESLLAAERN